MIDQIFISHEVHREQTEYMSTWKKYNYKSGKDFLKKTKKNSANYSDLKC